MNHKKSEWSKYVDDKALLRVNGKIKFKMHGYDGIVSRDSNTVCFYLNQKHCIQIIMLNLYLHYSIFLLKPKVQSLK